MEIELSYDESNGYTEAFLVENCDRDDYDQITTYLMDECNMEFYDFNEDEAYCSGTLYVDKKEVLLCFDSLTGISIKPLNLEKAKKVENLEVKEVAQYLFTELKGIFD